MLRFIPCISTDPPEMVTFSEAIALSISDRLTLAACILNISTFIWISRSKAPTISTLVISFNASISSCISSAYLLSLSNSKSPEILIYIIGISEKSISITFGSAGISLGKSVFDLSTASLTFCLASATVIPVLNSIIIVEKS